MVRRENQLLTCTGLTKPVHTLTISLGVMSAIMWVFGPWKSIDQGLCMRQFQHRALRQSYCQSCLAMQSMTRVHGQVQIQRRSLVSVAWCYGDQAVMPPMVFLPRDRSTAPCTQTSWCQWCVHKGPKKSFFKIRDGPVDWHFCNVMHAELWLEYRHKKETHQLLRMLPPERLEYLNGRTMEDIISSLFPEGCAPRH